MLCSNYASTGEQQYTGLAVLRATVKGSFLGGRWRIHEAETGDEAPKSLLIKALAAGMESI